MSNGNYDTGDLSNQGETASGNRPSSHTSQAAGTENYFGKSFNTGNQPQELEPGFLWLPDDVPEDVNLNKIEFTEVISPDGQKVISWFMPIDEGEELEHFSALDGSDQAGGFTNAGKVQPSSVQPSFSAKTGFGVNSSPGQARQQRQRTTLDSTVSTRTQPKTQRQQAGETNHQQLSVQRRKATSVQSQPSSGGGEGDRLSFRQKIHLFLKERLFKR